MAEHGELERLDTVELARRCAAGDAEANDALFTAVYEDLRRRARRLRRQSGGGTLSTTALVHETYLKLAGSRLAPQDRQHFYAIAARAMRQVLLNAIRARNASKRGGDAVRVTLEQDRVSGPRGAVDVTDLFALDAAIRQLEDRDRRLAQVVELHFFAGLGFAEIAALLDLSVRTISRDWRVARALLRQAMTADAT